MSLRVSVRKRKCVHEDAAKRGSQVKRMIRRVARLQAQRNGYFDGHISKRQNIGTFETRKLVAKMHRLREKHLDAAEKGTGPRGVRAHGH